MLAVLGFIVLIGVGITALFVAGCIFIGSSLFGGVEVFPVVFFVAIGVFLIWLAGAYSPFHIMMAGG